jgi:glutathione synthase/RimK-type ligase-like ATP-grasp enzyme
MAKIGVLFGMETTFPGALVERINAMEVPGVAAEFVQTGAARMAEPCGYDVVVDRISHDIPFYRTWLKNAALTGTRVINNPFWWSADDKFFNYALAAKLGVAVPPTVALPHKEHPPAPPTGRCATSVPARLGGRVRVRRLPRLPQAVRRRRLA